MIHPMPAVSIRFARGLLLCAPALLLAACAPAQPAGPTAAEAMAAAQAAHSTANQALTLAQKAEADAQAAGSPSSPM